MGELGADLNARDQAQFAPAHTAACCGHADALRTLHALDADLNARTLLGYGPAYFAAAGGHVNALRALHELGVDLAALDKFGHAQAHHAARHGAVDILTCLHNLKVDLDAPDALGYRPVHAAALTGQVASLDRLCELGRGGDLNAVTPEGHTPAYLAARHGHTEFLQRLRKHGVDLSQSPAGGWALAQAAADHDQINTLAAMIRWGVAMPQTWPPGLAEVGPQRVNQAAVAAAIAELEGSKDVNHTNLAKELSCPVDWTAFNTEGPNRPVRWTDGDSTIVMHASAASKVLSGASPKHPYGERVITPEACVAVVESEAFRVGDAQRLAQVRAARGVMLAGGPPEGRLGRLVEAVNAASASVPQWRRVLDADQQRVAAGAPAAPARAARCVIS